MHRRWRRWKKKMKNGKPNIGSFNRFFFKKTSMAIRKHAMHKSLLIFSYCSFSVRFSLSPSMWNHCTALNTFMANCPIIIKTEHCHRSFIRIFFKLLRLEFRKQNKLVERKKKTKTNVWINGFWFNFRIQTKIFRFNWRKLMFIAFDRMNKCK